MKHEVFRNLVFSQQPGYNDIVYTIDEFITNDKMSVKDILEMDIEDFCNQIII